MTSKITKPAVILPIIVGLAAGVALFLMGNAEDAPGLGLIGIVIAFVLILWGVYNVGAIKKELLAPIVSFTFGLGGIVLSIVLLLDGEFEESPGLALIGVVLGIAMICAGAIQIRKRRKEND